MIPRRCLARLRGVHGSHRRATNHSGTATLALLPLGGIMIDAGQPSTVRMQTDMLAHANQVYGSTQHRNGA